MRAVVLVMALLALLATAPEARAHASLLSAEPSDGLTLAQSPSDFRLDFNEPVSPLVFRLTTPDGASTTLTRAAAVDKTVTVTAPPMPQEGTYVLSWRVVSADGHPVGGAIVFSIGHPSASLPRVPAETDHSLDIVVWFVKFLLYAALFAGVGGAAFSAWFATARPLPGRAIYAGAMAGGAIAVVLSLPLQGLDALAQPLSAIWRPDVWAAGLGTAYGFTALLAGAAIALGLLVLRTDKPGRARALALLAVVAIGLALAMSGHASSAQPRWLTRGSVFLHGVCIAFWIGALLPLILTVRAGDRAVLDRFSRLIPLPLAVLVGTGVVLAVVQLDRPDALWTTEYGLVLSGKLFIVLALLVLAAGNRYALVPRLAAGEGEPLVTSVAIELTLALAIFALVGLWRFTPPPRALAATETAFIHFHDPRAMAQINITPERGRGAQVDIEISDSDFHAVAANEVALVVWNPAAGIEPLRRSAVNKGGGRWRIDGFHIPVGGVWRMRAEILLGDFDKVMIEDNVLLPRAP